MRPRFSSPFSRSLSFLFLYLIYIKPPMPAKTITTAAIIKKTSQPEIEVSSGITGSIRLCGSKSTYSPLKPML
jgi:hypothetical protein